MSVLDVEVSLFASYINPKPIKTIKLIDWLTKTNNKLKSSVNDLRKTTTKAGRYYIKSRLPAITPSGVFEKRSINNLIKHSGIISLDFDDCNPNVAKDLLSKYDFVAYVGESVSGNGVFALVPIKDADMHKEHFLSLKNKIEKETILKIDKSGSDVSRLRGYSFDEKAYFNHNAEIYSDIEREVYKMPTFVNTSNNDIDDKRFMKLLSLIESTSMDITSDRDDWIRVGLAIAGKYGERGRGYFHSISKNYSGYKVAETNHQYNSFLRMQSKVEIGSIFHIAKQYGVMLN